ncbi:hypothetical protein LOK49_LG08G02297 [Camellia lanceoleosa]|uniref:Uncharacterized protein n=1 Tax=Camellia lanceoleosa TaxID=1840588 RepID=A0ACC0GWQ2_9ERIC|nr:hypothetical protein LOK49_LG08G02297 [Camellia lanceoleosa]
MGFWVLISLPHLFHSRVTSEQNLLGRKWTRVCSSDQRSLGRSQISQFRTNWGSDQGTDCGLRRVEVMVLCWLIRQTRRSDRSGHSSFLRKPFGLT